MRLYCTCLYSGITAVDHVGCARYLVLLAELFVLALNSWRRGSESEQPAVRLSRSNKCVCGQSREEKLLGNLLYSMHPYLTCCELKVGEKTQTLVFL